MPTSTFGMVSTHLISTLCFNSFSVANTTGVYGGVVASGNGNSKDNTNLVGHKYTRTLIYDSPKSIMCCLEYHPPPGDCKD